MEDKKKSKKKAVAKAGVIKIFTVTITYRHDDGLSNYIFPALSLKEAYKLAILDLKEIIKEEEDLDSSVQLEEYPNSLDFIKEDEEAEFVHYYNQFSEIGSISDSYWNLTTATIKGNKLTYTVEG